MPAPYDENVEIVKLNGGLWQVDLISHCPPNESFCVQFMNTYVKADGSIGQRPGMTYYAGLTTPPSRNTPLHYPVGRFSSSAGASAMVLDAEYNYSSTPKRVFVFAQPGSGNTNGATTTIGNDAPTAFVEYLNTIYFSTSTAGVKKITSVTWPGPTLAVSAIASSPNLQGMVYFKGRLFGFSGSTVYFTEAVVGANLPETWNTSTNTIVVNAAGATPTIYKMMVFNDRILIFTSNGLFILTVSGSPSSWILKPLDLAISVNSKDCAFEHRGLIYFIDKTGVWVTNGNSSDLISEPISYVFNYSGVGSYFSIYKVGNFLVISVTARSKLSDTPYYNNNYYTSFENLGSWGKMYFGAGAYEGPIVASLSEVPITNSNSIRDAFIVSKVLSSQFANIFSWLPDSVTDEGVSSNATIESSWLAVGRDFEYKHIKYGYLVWKSAPSSGSVNITVTLQDGTSILTSITSTTSVGLMKFQVGNISREVKVTVQWSDVANTAVLDSIVFVVGTERKGTERSSS